MRGVVACLLLGLLVPIARAPIAVAQSTPETIACYDHFHRYVEAIGEGDLDRALAFWWPGDRAAAGRLGITHPGPPMLKIDSDSPIWRIQESLRDGTADFQFGPAAVTRGGPLSGSITMMLRVYEGKLRTTKQYLFEPDGSGGYLLRNQARYLAEQGPGSPGEYVMVYERRPGASWELPLHLIADLDAAVAAMADRLRLPAERREILAREKLGYLLVAPDVVEYLAGAPTAGVANLQVDLVVTHHPYHAHELAHLLVNFWLQDVPLYTLPLLQEGLATHLGGRWGRAPGVLAKVGRTSLRTGIVSLEELLTRAGFFGRAADLTYAPSGEFVGYLLDEFGADALRRVYLACSGTLAEVDAWTADEVRARISRAVGQDWGELVAEFERHLDLAPDRAILSAPTTVPDGGEVVTREVDPYRIDVVEAEDTIRLSVTSTAGPVHAALLFGGGDRSPERNPVFSEQVPGHPYRGETHALVLTPQEAKLYDLRQQTLTGLHSEGFWPSETFARDGGRTVTLDVRKGALPPLEAARIVSITP